MQDEYLLLVDNDIKDVVEPVNFRSEQKEKMQQIEDIQQEVSDVACGSTERIGRA